jgi:fatty acid desaturase
MMARRAPERARQEEDAMAKMVPYSEIARRTPPQWWEPAMDRKVLRELTQRGNWRAIGSHSLYFLLLAAVGVAASLIFQSGSLWWILAFFVYGTLFGMCNSRVHESLHGTPLKATWLNEVVYFLTSAMEIRCPLSTRWSHMIHHSYTQLTDTDLEIQAPRPVKLWKILLDFFYLRSLLFQMRTLGLHAIGIPTREARHTVPESEYTKIFWSSRFTVAVHLGVIGLAIGLGSWLPILLFTLPRLYGGWLIWTLILAQHSGLAEDVLDHRLSTRSIRLNPFLSFLYMHMENHIEHHLYPNIPFHSLRRFRTAIDSQMPPACTSLWAACREMVPTLWRQRHDAGYFIHRELPGPGGS